MASRTDFVPRILITSRTNNEGISDGTLPFVLSHLQLQYLTTVRRYRQQGSLSTRQSQKTAGNYIQLETMASLVVFDFDGTLFDTQQSISHSIKLTFDALSPTQSPSESEVQRYISSGTGLSDTAMQRRVQSWSPTLWLMPWSKSFQYVMPCE